ncbi:MAG: PEP-CTERM sorting domain-containing protein [Microcystis aeruginosa LG13-11]|nr:PEP-CTERM sorting domain-containing protein [Microcystis aeruginosa LG13-11]
MMTTNKLTKTFASGSLAIGVLAGSVFTATSASAMKMVDWEDFKIGTPISEGDKQVKLTSYVNGGSIDLSDTSIPVMVIFGDVGGGEYRLSILGEINGPDTFTYEISILPAFPNNYFTGVQLDSDVNVNLANGGYGNVQKRIAELPTLLLTSTDGNPDPFSAFYPIPGGLRTLTVTDTLIPNPGGSLTSLSNKFTQATQVPEPGTILGLLAVGGLGLVSRFGKQK